MMLQVGDVLNLDQEACRDTYEFLEKQVETLAVSDE